MARRPTPTGPIPPHLSVRRYVTSHTSAVRSRVSALPGCLRSLTHSPVACLLVCSSVSLCVACIAQRLANPVTCMHARRGRTLDLCPERRVLRASRGRNTRPLDSGAHGRGRARRGQRAWSGEAGTIPSHPPRTSAAAARPIPSPPFAPRPTIPYPPKTRNPGRIDVR